MNMGWGCTNLAPNTDLITQHKENSFCYAKPTQFRWTKKWKTWMNQHFRNDMATNRMPPRFAIATRCDCICHTIWNTYWLISNPILYVIALHLSFVLPLSSHKGCYCCFWYDVGFFICFYNKYSRFWTKQYLWNSHLRKRKKIISYTTFHSTYITINRVSSERLYLYSNGLFSLLLSCGHFKKFSQ